MQIHADKNRDNQSRSLLAPEKNEQNRSSSTLQFEDSRAEAIQMRKLQEMANNHTEMNSLRFADNRTEAIAQRKPKVMMNNSPKNQRLAQFQKLVNQNSTKAKQEQPVQKKAKALQMKERDGERAKSYRYTTNALPLQPKYTKQYSDGEVMKMANRHYHSLKNANMQYKDQVPNKFKGWFNEGAEGQYMKEVRNRQSYKREIDLDSKENRHEFPKIFHSVLKERKEKVPDNFLDMKSGEMLAGESETWKDSTEAALANAYGNSNNSSDQSITLGFTIIRDIENLVQSLNQYPGAHQWEIKDIIKGAGDFSTHVMNAVLISVEGAAKESGIMVDIANATGLENLRSMVDDAGKSLGGELLGAIIGPAAIMGLTRSISFLWSELKVTILASSEAKMTLKELDEHREKLDQLSQQKMGKELEKKLAPLKAGLEAKLKEAEKNKAYQDEKDRRKKEEAEMKDRQRDEIVYAAHDQQYHFN